MEDFKVGEKVVVTSGTTLDSQRHAGETVTIKEIKGPIGSRGKYFLSDELPRHQSGIYLDEVKKVPKTEKVEVKKQRRYEVSSGNIGIRYTTNTKRDRVSIINNGGHTAARIKFDDIDNLIKQLNRLKDEVALDDDSLQA